MFNGKRLEADDDYKFYASNTVTYVNNKGQVLQSSKVERLTMRLRTATLRARMLRLQQTIIQKFLMKKTVEETIKPDELVMKQIRTRLRFYRGAVSLDEEAES